MTATQPYYVSMMQCQQSQGTPCLCGFVCSVSLLQCIHFEMPWTLWQVLSTLPILCYTFTADAALVLNRGRMSRVAGWTWLWGTP